MIPDFREFIIFDPVNKSVKKSDKTLLYFYIVFYNPI